MVRDEVNRELVSMQYNRLVENRIMTSKFLGTPPVTFRLADNVYDLSISILSQLGIVRAEAEQRACRGLGQGRKWGNAWM
jgi:hypothetical protein